ncbi:AAA family ATPase [Flavobacterium agrisoli]|uniref:AAA family ATPase n=1 Tax=Flavobacterium agrisoli TaxID=2793066 RepID=A0A934UKD9_9FLAO|nr:AAA family ATPase [Flavobacterium agrisoli]MBK0370981.1 AAA family ATPase [Flavobacterium agrisoli]
MKISKLHIDQFRHLENIEFDFTYPEDFHIEEKRGKPLDKICFIGQSATGKTGLLELIYDYSSNVLNLEVIEGTSLSGLRTSVKNIDGEVKFIIKDEVLTLRKKELLYKQRIYIDEKKGGTVTDLIPLIYKKDIFYFKANIISSKNIDVFEKNPVDLIEKYNSELSHIEDAFKYRDRYGMLFDEEVEITIWLFLLNEILKYRKNFTQKMSELIHQGLLANNNKLMAEFNKWQKENPNKLEAFAQKFNPIIEKLNLEVDLINTEFSIPIKNKRNDEIIPIQNTSTGTKGLLLSFLPLFKFDTKDSIILIDEPERSLYPDIQMDLMGHYKSLAPEAQFIVATHSPFVAASFEPDERFILYFDEDGKVAVRRGISPIGDDPNDILKNDFKLESLMNERGVEAFERYRDLKKRLASEKNEVKKDKLLEEILLLANAYKF